MTLITQSVQHYHLRQFLLTFIIVLSVVSCVTINIYFPAAAAEKAAEKIVDEVLQSDQTDVTPQDSGNTQGLLHNKQISTSNRIILAISNFVIPVAEAGQANISIDSANIRTIRNNMEKRQSSLRPFYDSGAVGFTNNGLIASVSTSGLSVKQKSTVKKLIQSENKDRISLYSEIAKANGHPEWQKDIQDTFSKTWIKKISSGWMYQSASGQWTKK